MFVVLVRKSCVVPTFLCSPSATIKSCGRYPKVMRSWVFSSGAGQRARSPRRGCQGPVRRLGRRRWADSATDGRTGLGGPATPAKRPREPEARGRPGAGGGGEASSPPGAASWALPPGPGPTEPPPGCGFLRPPRGGLGHGGPRSGESERGL